MIDVAVIGAGAAGLQAALTLGRMHRSTTVFGTERYRNDPADHMHNFLGHDGRPPVELRDAARADIARYDSVDLADTEVIRVSGSAGAFTVMTADGDIEARRVLLATGVIDTLPDVPGVTELFGDLVAHCPFCHGHEFAGEQVGILGAPHAPHLAGMLSPIASEIVCFPDGERPDADTAAALRDRSVAVREESVTEVRRAGSGIEVVLEGADPVALGGLFVKTTWRQAAPFAAQLELEMTEAGAVAIDAFGRTSLAGVFAAGDMAQGPGLPMPMAAVLPAASSGLMAAAACVQELAA